MVNPHIARNFVARAVEVRKVRVRRAKLILEKTEGVPLFIEEFVKSLDGLRLEPLARTC
jgi:hypothetical protein